MLNTENINNFAEQLQTLGKSPSTIEAYLRDAKRFSQYLELHKIKQIGLETVTTYLEFLTRKDEKPNSIRRTIIGLKQFFRYLEDIHVIAKGQNFLEQVIIPQREELPQLYLHDDQIENLLTATEATFPELKSLRDKALICMLSFEGLKASEIVLLNWSHFFSNHKASTLKIPGKKSRIISLDSKTAEAIVKYQKSLLDFYQNQKSPQKMFVAFKGPESNVVLPNLTRHGLKFMLAEYAIKISVKRLNSELLRHYAIHYQVEKGKSIDDLMAHLGLRRLGNIAKYINRNENQAQL